MPIYEYRCDNGHLFEVMQRMSDAPVATCEVCGAPVQRVFHPVAVHFKGKGFYNTDYGTKKRQRELKAAGEGSGSSDGGGESSSSSSTTTETKSADSSAPAKTEKAAAPSKKSDSGSS